MIELVKLNEIYKCDICGNVVSVLEAGDGELICCGQPMILLEEKTSKDEGNEKHVPIVELDDNRVIVRIGSKPHPMEAKHYIELVQIVKNGQVIAGKRLNPSEKPEAEFCLEESAEGITARILCNIHGLWKSH